jgi:hypothetical protein
LRNALELREKLLLRQLEVLNHRPDKNQIDISEISFQTQNENEILEMLRTYGNFQNIESFLSYLESFEEEENAKDQLYEKKIDSIESLDNKKLSESIINLTVKESHDLVTKSESLVSAVQDKLKIFLPTSSDIDKTSIDVKTSIKQPAQTQEVKVKENEKEKLKRNSGTTSSKKKTLKNISNMTLNNYCGSIILKNISNLTINTCKQKPADVPVCSEPKTCEPVFYPQCDFYEKLISENEVLKRSIVNQSVKCTTYPDMISQVCMSPTKSNEKDDATYSITSASSIDCDDKKLELNLDAVKGRSSIEAHMGEAFTNHPPMIQCWLSKMYTETETEPQNNIEILEFSKIA